MEAEGLVTSEEAVALLGVCSETIYRWYIATRVFHAWPLPDGAFRSPKRAIVALLEPPWRSGENDAN
jgi:hypothetical protein